jgi:hypothetical protein
MMFKNIFILLFIIFKINLNAFAQSNWAPIGATWVYKYIGTFSNESNTAYIKSIGDTIIQGKQCRKLINNNSGCAQRSLYEYMYEDSGKVYYFESHTNSFQLLFDINKNIGENFSLGLWGDSIVYVVDSVSSIIINGHHLKKLVVHRTHAPSSIGAYYSGTIIESLGNTFYMFPWSITSCDIGDVRPLGCYQDSVLGYYNFGTIVNCTTNTDIIPPVYPVYIYPNPNTGKFIIQSKNHNINIELFDVLGQSVLTEIYPNEYEYIEIDLRKRTKGIYIMKLRTAGQTIIRKLILN